MSTEVQAGLIAGIVSVVTSVATGLMTMWVARNSRRYKRTERTQQLAQAKAEQAEAILSRYREPLLLAAQNLHSRLYSIVKSKVLFVYLGNPDPNLERYGRDYTAYVIAEYLCWAEIIRRDLRFLDLAADAHNRELVRRLEDVQLALANPGLPNGLKMFRGDQRAIGEMMMIAAKGTDAAPYESLGYVQFCSRLAEDPTFASWFRRLRDGMDTVRDADDSQEAQIIHLQHTLVDLIEFLDPDHWRLPGRLRDRLALPNTPTSTIAD
jgi:hypothetical protein